VSSQKDVKPLLVVEPGREVFDLGLRATWAHHRLVSLLVWRDLRVRYAQTLLGVTWAILQPLVLLLVFMIVFGRIVTIPSEGLPYSVFAFTALLPWAYMAQAVNRSGVSLLNEAHLIRKVYFPRLVLPLSAALAPLADLGVSLCLLLIMLLWHRIVPGLAVLSLPVFLMFAVASALAAGVWFAALSARYRDIRHVIPLVVQVWLFASPIVYPASLVPEGWRRLYDVNPAAVVVEGFRWALLGRNSPRPEALVVSACLVGACLVTGLLYFRKTERILADVL
jgi:lipopolysaccharide transport system permease protein